MKSEPRRSLSVALQTTDLPAEAIALIQAGSPKPRSGSRALEPLAPEEALVESATPSQTRPTEPQPGQDQHPKAAPPAAVSSVNEVQATPKGLEKPAVMGRTISATGAVSVALTVRVPAGLPIRLLRAATDRKINQQSPFTQQEIVAQALEQWLQTQGY